MERKYYEINEAAARRSKEMMSFDDYREGSATSAYRQEAEQIYQLAEKVAERRPDAAEKAEKLADQYAKLLADYYNTNFRIDQMCPSIMIAGPANFPVRKKEKQNQAWNRNREKYERCKAIESKLGNLLYGREIITAGDPELRKTQSGLSVCSFQLAVDRPKQKGQDDAVTDWISCQAWRQSADYLSQYAHKGAIVGVEGRLQIDNYDDKDGRRVYKTTVQCDNVKLISGYGNQEHSASQKADSDASFEEYMRDAPTLEISSDDFPF